MKTLVNRIAVPVMILGTLVLTPAALASPGDVILASTSDDGSKAEGGASGQVFFRAPLSADGTKVAFLSDAMNLDPADNDAVIDVYVKNLVTGDITLASTSDAGVKANGDNWALSLSADGTKVAFQSLATNLDIADTDGTLDLYVKDLLTGNITLASTSDAGIKANDGSGFGTSGGITSLSASGTQVAFESAATNLDPADTDGLGDVYVKDLSTGNITLASTSATGIKSNGESGFASLSADGTRVAFGSQGTNLDPGDTDDIGDVFVKDLTSGDIILASSSASGTKGDNVSFFPSLSARGIKVAFVSWASFDQGDGDDVRDIYVKNLTTGNIILASTSDNGTKANGHWTNAPSLSADGRSVAFSAISTNLDPADNDNASDIYVKNLSTGNVALASTSDDGVKSNGSAAFPSLSGDGTRVAFYSDATNLDPADTDTRNDVYVKIIASASADCGGHAATIVGTSSNDVLVGTSGIDVIAAGDGDDVVRGRQGGDLICSGGGADTIYGGLGRDNIQGGGGSDALSGGYGDDVIHGNRGNDDLEGGAGNDWLFGDSDVDSANGGLGKDRCRAEQESRCEV